MTANPDDDPARPVTAPGSATRPARTCLTPAAPIGPTLAYMTPGDRAEVVAILDHLGDPREDSSDDGARERGPAQFSTTPGIVRWPSSRAALDHYEAKFGQSSSVCGNVP